MMTFQLSIVKFEIWGLWKRMQIRYLPVVKYEFMASRQEQ